MANPEKPRLRFNHTTGQWMAALPSITNAAKTEPAEPRYLNRFGASQRSSAGMYVNPDIAMTYSVVYTCVLLLCETISMLSWHTRKKVGDKNEVDYFQHPAHKLLHTAASDEIDAGNWRKTTMVHKLLQGNGYSEIEKTNAGRAAALHLLTPERVQPGYDNQGQLWYEVSNNKEPNTFLRPDEIFHTRGLGYDAKMGLSVISFAAQSLGIGLALDQFAGSFFSNGAHMGGTLEHPTTMTETAATNFMRSFREKFTGAGNAFKFALLEDGIKFHPFEINAQDAQMIESRKFQAIDACRWFRVPPNMIYEWDKTSYSNAFQADKTWVQYSIAPHVDTFQREANIKLISPNQRGEVFTKMILQDLVQGSFEDRAKFYESGMKWGWLSINDVRCREGLNPVKGGDVIRVPMNMAQLNSDGSIDGIEPGESESVDSPLPDSPDATQAAIKKLKKMH